MTSNIHKALPHYLKNYGALSSLVSDRVYPLRLPQGATLPAITYQDISMVADQPQREASKLPKYRFQMTIYGVLIETIDGIMRVLKTALDGYRGNMGTGTYVTVVDGVLLKDERSNDDPATGLYIRQQDYLIIVKE